MHEAKPIPFPAQLPPARLRIRSFYIREAPPGDHESAPWTWACEDCGTSDTAESHAALGAHIAVHMKMCAG
jgi:hypothetical protein